MLVSDTLYNPFPNITLDDIYKSLLILDGSLTGYYGKNLQSNGENYCTSQARVEIKMVEIYSKAVIEVSSVSFNLNFLESN